MSRPLLVPFARRQLLTPKELFAVRDAARHPVQIVCNIMLLYVSHTHQIW